MEETGHGHSVAAWTGVTILIVAATLISVGIFFGLPWANWAGVGLTVVGVAAWYGLHQAGYGGLTAAHDRPDEAGAEPSGTRRQDTAES